MVSFKLGAIKDWHEFLLLLLQKRREEKREVYWFVGL